MESKVEETREKKDQAKKKLEKRLAEFSTKEDLTPEQRVQLEIKKKYEQEDILAESEKNEIEEGKFSEKQNEKPKYFTDSLSRLDKNKRKLVAQIMGIVTKIAPEDIANEIQAAIVKEFR